MVIGERRSGALSSCDDCTATTVMNGPGFISEIKPPASPADTRRGEDYRGMKLSAQQFADLAASFSWAEPPAGSDAQACGMRERRRGTRLELQSVCKIMPVVDGRRATEAIQVDVCDFSARGIAILHQTAMQVGDQFVTELPRQGGGRVQLLCRVANVRQVSGESYRIGAEFICSVQPELRSPGGADGVSDLREVQRIRQSMLG